MAVLQDDEEGLSGFVRLSHDERRDYQLLLIRLYHAALPAQPNAEKALASEKGVSALQAELRRINDLNPAISRRLTPDFVRNHEKEEFLRDVIKRLQDGETSLRNLALLWPRVGPLYLSFYPVLDPADDRPPPTLLLDPPEPVDDLFSFTAAQLHPSLRQVAGDDLALSDDDPGGLHQHFDFDVPDLSNARVVERQPPLANPPPIAPPPAQEPARDVGNGTSKSVKPKGDKPPVKKQKKQPPTPVAQEAPDSSADESTAPAIARRQPKKVPKPKPLPRQQLEEVEDTDDDALRLDGYARHKPRGKRKKSTKLVVRTRTSFRRAAVQVKPPNPHDEANLVAAFPPKDEPGSEHKPRSTRRTYVLDEFYMHRRGRPDQLVQLHKLLKAAGSKPDVVLVGSARPARTFADPAEDDALGDQITPPPPEKPGPAQGPAIAHAQNSEGKDGQLEVHLFAKYDIRRLTLTSSGPVLVTKVADYQLGRPMESLAPSANRRRSVGPGGARKKRVQLSYTPLVRKFRRLLNLYTLARHHSVRGNYVQGDDETLRADVEVQKVVNKVRWLIDNHSRESKWRADLPELWRIGARDLCVEKGDEALLFRSLPDIPFIPPEPYKLIKDFFPANTFRTHDRGRADQELAAERAAERALLDKYRKYNADWREARRRRQPQTAKALGSFEVRASPNLVKDLIDDDKISPANKKPVLVYRQALIDGVRYRAGDIVLVPPSSTEPAALGSVASSDDDSESEEELEIDDTYDDADPMDKKGMARPVHPARNLEQLSDDEGDDDWETADEDELDHDNDDGKAKAQATAKGKTAAKAGQPDGGEDSLWFAQIEYFFLEKDTRDHDNLEVHLSWFTTPEQVPSLGVYCTPRMLLKMDRCDSWVATDIACRIDDCDWNSSSRLRSALYPSTGFFCWAAYNDQDGHFSDLSQLRIDTPTHCIARKLHSCDSCEGDLRYVEATVKLPKGSKDKRRPEKARRTKDDKTLFRLGTTDYHAGDFVLVDSLEHRKMPVEPNMTVHGQSSVRARVPLRIARIVGLWEEDLDRDSCDDSVDQVEIQWVIRLQELPYNATAQHDLVSSREVVLTVCTDWVPATNVHSRCNVRHLDSVVGDSNPSAAIVQYERASALNYWVKSRIPRWDGGGEPRFDKGGVLSRDLRNTRNSAKLKRERLEPDELRVCQLCAPDHEKRDQTMRRLAKLRSRDDFELAGCALYAGGGLLDLGMEDGCRLLRTAKAVEHHGPAATCYQSNCRGTTFEASVSDVMEAVYYGRKVYGPSGSEQELPEPGRLFCLTGGSPCQGFSLLNRHKTLDDLRCAEPFVYLAALGILRPLHGLFENVAAFWTHALPVPRPGHARGSFFKLFMTVALALRYQARWSVANAAAFGVPQFRKRLIVQLAVSGVSLPKEPPLSHALRDGREFRNHRLFEERRDDDDDAPEGIMRRKKSKHDHDVHAPHWAVTISEATSDLAAFSIQDCFPTLGEYEQRLYGKEYTSQNPAAYGSTPTTSFQLAVRTLVSSAVLGHESFAQSEGMTHHVCRSLPEYNARRILKLKPRAKGATGEGGNHEDLKGDDLYPIPPPWVSRSQKKLAQWWRRLEPGMIIAPLRTQLAIDGSSHGERIHWEQPRPLSFRELLRAQGVPDAYELNFSEELGDDAFDEQLRVIGNGVPFLLASAYGRAVEDSLLDLIIARLDERERTPHKAPSGNVWARKWRECHGEQLRLRPRTELLPLEMVAHAPMEVDREVSPTPEASPAPSFGRTSAALSITPEQRSPPPVAGPSRSKHHHNRPHAQPLQPPQPPPPPSPYESSASRSSSSSSSSATTIASLASFSKPSSSARSRPQLGASTSASSIRHARADTGATSAEPDPRASLSAPRQKKPQPPQPQPPSSAGQKGKKRRKVINMLDVDSDSDADDPAPARAPAPARKPERVKPMKAERDKKEKARSESVVRRHIETITLEDSDDDDSGEISDPA